MENTFKSFSEQIRLNFSNLQQNGNKLFKSSLSGNDLWDLYLASFKEGDNPVFRDPQSSSHNDNLDKSFIRRYGNVVTMNAEFEIITMWDNVPESKYSNSCREMSKTLKNSTIADVFFETFEELNSLPYEKCTKTQSVYRLGIEKNHKIYSQEEADKFGVVKPGEVYQFFHFNADLSKDFVDATGKSQASILSEYRASKEVFKRGLDEIPLDTLELVRDLINQGSLLDGETHLYKIEAIIPFKKVYSSLSEKVKDNWSWITSYKLAFAKFRNELIGTLCVELAEGVELNLACQTWNKRVDPANYMKAKAPITANQIKEAQTFVEENNYTESFNRRFATLEDINVDEILHSNIGKNEVKPASIFDTVKPTVSTRHKKSQFEGIEEVAIDKFMKDILPTCSSVEMFFENRMENNLVALTTADKSDSKKMFKWDNNFSWTYKGNLAGKSMIKEAVKTAGGKVDGVLRFSIMWADGDGDNSDLDAHCVEPDRNEIYFSDKRSYRTDGNLDIDITQPGGRLAVENITYPSLVKMMNGNYRFFVRQYSARSSRGFKAEIEFNGEIFQYEYNRPVSGDIDVAIVSLNNGEFTIDHKLPETNSSRKVWNLDTNHFHKVNLVSLSPNFWGANNTGNKHYMFMIDGCKSDSPLRSFHNENLNGELLQHRKVTEVLGATTMLNPSEKQLCGIGLNATVKDEVILKLTGTHKRTIKVKI